MIDEVLLEKIKYSIMIILLPSGGFGMGFFW